MLNNITKSILIIIQGLCFAIAGGTLIFMLFYQLDTLTMRLWDESRNAANALEMYYNHNYIVKHYLGKPDMWELKPPFLVWTQQISLHLFGINEFAIRLPSVLAIVALAVALFGVAKKHSQYVFIGFLVVLNLALNPGIFGAHIARFGDHDALLCLFSFGSIYAFYRWSLKPDSLKWSAWFWVFLAFAWLTKSIVALFFGPAWIIYLLLSKKLFIFIKNRTFWIGFAGFLIIPALYYLWHEILTPGYLNEVWNHELFNRYAGNRPEYHTDHSQFFIYFQSIWGRLGNWYFLLPLCIVLSFRKTANAHFMRYLLLCSVCTLLVISYGPKNFWYDAVVLVLLILLNVLALSEIFSLLKNRIYQWIFVVVVLIITLAFNLKNYSTIKKSNVFDVNIEQDDTMYKLAYLLRDETFYKENDSINLLYNDMEAPLRFYIIKLQKEQKKVIREWMHPKPKDLTLSTYYTNDTAIVAMAKSIGYTAKDIDYQCYKLKKEIK